MRKNLLVLLAAAALWLLACDVSSLVTRFVPQKDLQDASATLQAVAPTIAAAVTQVPQAKAGATSAPGASANPFTDALGKAKGATKYRVEFSMVFGGMQSGKYEETPFISFKGEMDGSNSHMTSTGGMLAMLAGGGNAPVEFISAGGKSYMKGVTIYPNTDPKVWYITDDSLGTSSFGDFAQPDEYKDWISGAKAGEIKKARTEPVDGQSCDVYVYDIKSLQNGMLLGLLGSAQDKNDFSAIDKGELDFWLCGDGYVHKFLMDYAGHDSKDATQKAALKMTWHAWDFNNAAIAVTAPKDAKPLPK